MLTPNDPRREKAATALRHVWSRFLTGVLVAVPLIVTFVVLNLAFTFIDGISAPLWKLLGLENIPGLGFFTTLALLVAVGYFATNVIGRQVIDTVETFIAKIPVIASLYNAVKQAIDSFKGMSGSQQFKRVAYVEYPSDGCFLIGFVTGQFHEPNSDREMTMIFLPTSPNPLTGFVVCIPCEKVIDSGLTLEQASKIIMSAGLVAPTPASNLSGVAPIPQSGTGN